MIHLINDYVINVDTNNYTLMIDKHKVNKKNEPVYETVGYYTSFASAINGAIASMNKRDLSIGEYSLNEAVEIIKTNNEQFTKLLNEKLGETEK